ncbi:MAG: 2Fe-2S iron-sulfur cluster binding domain-containing protein [Bacillus sp. (in: Bacteria)]|nr:2Fe-2S iron-sulfur cluster binding domain-containing protein [Bacillus sp. (in: firmicutes)]
MNERRLTVGSLKSNSQPKVIPPKVKKDNHINSINNRENNNQLRKIIVEQKNQVFNIIPDGDQSLLDTGLEQEQMISYKCKKGTCGKCAVKILQGSYCLSDITQQEGAKLKEKISLGYRLACQAMIGTK